MDAGLLERGHDLGGLVALGTAGHGRVGVVEGPAGIGKSALLDAARQAWADDGRVVLATRGSTLESAFPFGAALRLFDPVVRDPARSERLLQGPAALAAPLLRPVDATAGDEFGVIRGLYWCVVNLAGDSEIVFVLDDLHWMDEPSLRFVSYLAERLEDLPLTLVMSVATGEPDALRPLVTHLTSLPGVVTLRPAPLTEAATGALLGDEALAPGAWAATGGNPFLVRELATALAAGAAPSDLAAFAPETVRRRVLLHLTRLGDDALAFARAGSVFADGAPIAAVAAAAGLDTPAAATAADRLRAADVLQAPGDGGVTFRHPMVRAAVREELPPGDGVRLHAAAAAALRDLAAPADVVAHHLAHAWPATAPWAYDALVDGGRLAGRQGRPDLGARYLRLALELSPADPAPELLLELGVLEAAGGETTPALERLGGALERLRDPLDQARALSALGRVLYDRGRLGEAADAFRRGSTLAAGSDRELSMALEGSALCASWWVGPLQPEIGERLDAIVSAAVAGGVNSPAERVLVAIASAHAVLTMPPVSVAGVLAHAVLGEGLPTEQAAGNVARTLAAFTLLYAERIPEALATATRIRAAARARGDGPAVAEAAAIEGLIRLADGQVVGALADAEAAISASEGWRAFEHAGNATLAQCLLLRGDLDGATAVLDQAWQRLAPPEADGLNGWLYVARGKVRLAAGDPDRALEDFLAAGAALEVYGVRNPAMLRWRSQAGLAADAQGDHSLAQALIDEELAFAREFRLPAEIGAAQHAGALLQTGAARERALTEAVATLEPTGRPLELAAALADLGSTLRRGGERSACRAPLSRALDLAERAGATALARRAHEELLASGARPRRRVISGIEALTPSQLRIAELAAEGLSNRDIAERLFLAQSTVAWHLRHVYRKLDVSSREGLAAAVSAS